MYIILSNLDEIQIIIHFMHLKLKLRRKNRKRTKHPHCHAHDDDVAMFTCRYRYSTRVLLVAVQHSSAGLDLMPLPYQQKKSNGRSQTQVVLFQVLAFSQDYDDVFTVKKTIHSPPSLSLARICFYFIHFFSPERHRNCSKHAL